MPHHQFPLNVRNIISTIAALILLSTTAAYAASDQQPWVAGGLGFSIWTKGTGAGLDLRGEAGYKFTRNIAAGLGIDYSRLGSVGLKMLNYSGFFQLTEPDSGLFGRFYLGGITIMLDGDYKSSGAEMGDTAIAPGIGVGMSIDLIPQVRLIPEVDYKIGIFSFAAVSIVQGTVSIGYDF